ncbi:hypothetical protein Aduo_000672 [Ancylostoma duodenale]
MGTSSFASSPQNSNSTSVLVLLSHCDALVPAAAAQQLHVNAAVFILDEPRAIDQDMGDPSSHPFSVAEIQWANENC